MIHQDLHLGSAQELLPVERDHVLSLRMSLHSIHFLAYAREPDAAAWRRRLQLENWGTSNSDLARSFDLLPGADVRAYGVFASSSRTSRP